MDVCCICLNDIKSKERHTLLCGHKFHRDCILKWKRECLIKGYYKCPMCRKVYIFPLTHIYIYTINF